MMLGRPAYATILFLTLMYPAFAQEDRPLTLDEAVEAALSADDPTVTRFEERAAAFDDRAISDAQLPDPQLRFNMANWPIDTFDYTQEPMTQIQMGLSQSFPKGRTLKYTGDQRRAQAKAERSGFKFQERQIVLETRQRWLQVFYWTGARQNVEESRAAIAELIGVLESVFATGRQTSQDLLRAQLELSLLDDRLVDVDRQIETARAELGRLVGGESASRPLPGELPALKTPSEVTAIRERLLNHPAVQVEDARIEAQERGIDIARQQYYPGVSVDAQYGVRGAEQADFASIGFRVDIPIFTGRRQDRRLSAAKRERQAARFDRQARLLDLEKDLFRTYADWQRLGDRIRLYRTVVVERASETSEASVTAYQNGVTDFPELVRARLAELDAKLTLLQLEVERAQASATLLFLEGDD